MGLDPKVRNMIKFMAQNLFIPVIVIVVFLRFAGIEDYFRLFGQTTLAFLVFKVLVAVYRRRVLPPKDYRKMGKWAIVTGKEPLFLHRLLRLSLFLFAIIMSY